MLGPAHRVCRPTGAPRSVLFSLCPHLFLQTVSHCNPDPTSLPQHRLALPAAWGEGGESPSEGSSFDLLLPSPNLSAPTPTLLSADDYSLFSQCSATPACWFWNLKPVRLPHWPPPQSSQTCACHQHGNRLESFSLKISPSIPSPLLLLFLCSPGA